MGKIFYPKVSIVIPVYNGANYMRDAIDSALEQTYKNIEVIVVNDGSNDNGKTDRIAKSYGDKIRYFSKPNGGVATALNLGIEKMEGEYFSWLSHDDVYCTKKIEHQIAELEKLINKKIVVAGCVDIVDEHLKTLYRIDPFKKYHDYQLENGCFALMRGCINGCALLIHRELFSERGVFDESLLTTQDYDLFFRLFTNNKILFLKTFDVKSRSHPEQGSKKLLDFHIKECNELWKKMVDSLSEADMIKIGGSVYEFLKGTHKYLVENTLYKDTIDYIDKKIISTLKNKQNLIEIKDYLLYQGIDSYVVEEFLQKINKRDKYDNKIAFFLTDINDRGGLNRVTIQIANELSKKYNVLMITGNINLTGYSILESVNCIVFNNLIFNEPVLFAKLLTILDVKIFINGYNCDKKFLDLYTVTNKYGIKTIAWNHEFYFVPYYNDTLTNCLKGRNNKFSLADYVIWINKFSYKLYSLFFNNGIYLPNPCTINNTVKKSTRTKHIIAAGRFDDERKGLKELLDTFSIVCSKNKTVVLDIIGKYDLEQLVPRSMDKFSYSEYIKHLQIPSDRIVFHGQVPSSKEYFDKSDLHIMTSYNEGFGLVILEAAACGVPTVAFDGSAAEDIITSGVDGYVVKYGDIEAMANFILEFMCCDDDRFFRMSSNASELAKKYSINNIMKKWQLLINRSINPHKTDAVDLRDEDMMIDYSIDKNFVVNISTKYEESIIKLLDSRTVVAPYTYNDTRNRSILSMTNLKKSYYYLKEHGFIKTLKKINSKLHGGI